MYSDGVLAVLKERKSERNLYPFTIVSHDLSRVIRTKIGHQRQERNCFAPEGPQTCRA